MSVFSEKLGRLGSWLVTTMSMWKREARKRRSARPEVLANAVVGTILARVPRCFPTSASAKGVRSALMLLLSMTAAAPPSL